MHRHSPETMIGAKADRAACRALLRNGSRSFFAASHLLPRSVRDPATALYAFCRLADDAVDEDRRGVAAVSKLRDRLDRAYRGQPLPLPADRAFADTVARFAIPRALPEALLEGLAWDTAGRRYDSLGDLHAYAARVAGSVGAMMAVVMGVTDSGAIARACDLGAAMQLTNIARDVGEDARAGRLYLPQSWLREVGIDPDAWLAAPRFELGIGVLVQRLLGEADRLYAASEAGIAALPFACRPGIRAARLFYAEIGAAVARQGYDSVTTRAVVSGRSKIALLPRALAPVGRPDLEQLRSPALLQAHFLVRSVESARVLPATAPNMGDKIIWVIDLLDRVERRRQALGGGF